MLENGRRSLKTHCGLVFSILMVLIIILYAVFKMGVMLNYLDNTLQEPKQDNYFDLDFVYTSDSNWKIGFGLVAYDSSSDPTPLRDSIGRLIVS